MKAACAGVDLQRAGKIAFADSAGELLVAERAASADQPARSAVAAGVRKGDAHQVIELLHAFAAELDHQVEPGQLGEVGDRPSAVSDVDPILASVFSG